jgi:hypothetical protein
MGQADRLAPARARSFARERRRPLPGREGKHSRKNKGQAEDSRKAESAQQS